MNSTLCLRSALVIGASAAALLSAAPVLAQTADPAASSEPNTLSTVIVTAEKRAQSIQKVPVAVTAFTAKQRSLQGITTVQDMTNFVPGLTYSTQLDRAQMRGIGRLSNTLSTDPAVAIYVDDFYQTSTFFVGLDDMVIDQTEIERGPQGTLYGRNAIGGLINSKTRRPTDTYTGEVRAVYGNYGTWKVEGTVSGPIQDGLNFRLTAVDNNQDQGYYRNLSGGPSEGGVVHDWYTSLMLEWKPNDRNDVWVNFTPNGFVNDRGGPGGMLGTPTLGPTDINLNNYSDALVFNPNFGYNPTTCGSVGCYNTGLTAGGVPIGAQGPVAGSVVGAIPSLAGGVNPAAIDIHSFTHSIPVDINLSKSFGFNFHWIHHFDNFDLKYVGGYNQYTYLLKGPAYIDMSGINSFQIPLNPNGTCANTAGCTPATVNSAQGFNYGEKNRWMSHEITISSTDKGPVQWIVGAYYFNQHYHDFSAFTQPDQPQMLSPVSLLGVLGGQGSGGAGAVSATNPLGFALAAPNPTGADSWNEYGLATVSAATYAQIDWKVTDTIKLTGGIRYTYDHKYGFEDARWVSYSNLTNSVLHSITGLTDPGFSAEGMGALMPAVDLTPAFFGGVQNTPYKGVSLCPGQAYASGTYAYYNSNGDIVRCLNDTSSAVTGTAGVEWTPQAGMLGYVRYTRGYKAFGFGAGPVTPSPESKPEFINDIEVGWKQNIGRTLQYNAALFYYGYDNAQIPVSMPLNGLDVTEFINVPKSESEGFELQVNWDPIPHLDLNFTYAFDHTAVDTGCSVSASTTAGLPNTKGLCLLDTSDFLGLAPGAKPVGVGAAPVATSTSPYGYGYYQNLKGNPLPQTPENKIAFNANYTWIFEPGNLTLSGTYVWKDKMYAGIFERAYDSAPAWDQVDARLTWSGNHDHYQVVLYVRNLFNTIGYDSAAGSTGVYQSAFTNLPGQGTLVDLTPPRTYGVELHYKF